MRVHTPLPLSTNATPPPRPATHQEHDGDKEGDRDADARSETESAKDATEFFLKRRVPAGQDKLPIDRYLTAREHMNSMPAFSIAGASPKLEHPNIAGGWTPLGPGNVGGRTRSLVIDPQNPSIMYAGAVTGGVWKTTNGGQSWTALTDMLPVLNIGSLVMDPFDPNTLYAGTGEFEGGFAGQGIFKTSNGGTTWTLLPATSSAITFDFDYVNRLVMSPTNHNRIYAATWTGIWTSGDGGATWSNTGLGQAQLYDGCEDLVIRTDQTTDYLFAACFGKTASASYTIWRNTDVAGTGAWSQVFTATHMARTSLAIAPSQQSTIYAMAASHGGDPNYEDGLLAVYRSTSNGDVGSWMTQVSNTDPDITNTMLLTDSVNVTFTYCLGGALTLSQAESQGSWDNSLAVDPLDPNRVWAGGVDVFRSDDGGVTWGVASLWQLAYDSPQFAHADRHLFVFQPGYDGVANQTMFMATDGGVFRTNNARGVVATGPKGTCQRQFPVNTAIQWANLNSGYAATQFYHGFAYPGGLGYMGGAQDNSVSRGSDASGSNGFVFFSTGDGAAVAVDPADANRIFLSKENLSLGRAIDGESLLDATAGITENPNNFPFIAFLAMDPNEGKRLYLGGSVDLWRSLDGGASWNAAAPVEALSSVGAIAVSPFDSNTVIFGSGFGSIYRNSAALTSTGNTMWASAQPRVGFVSSIAFDPTNPNIVYAVYSTFKTSPADAHVYRSIDGGVTWTPSDGAGTSALPDIPMWRLIVNPYNPLQLFLGSDLGMFVSLDGGTTWNRDTSLEDVIVEELGLDNGNNSNWLFAFTYGRGMYRAPLPGSASPNCSYNVSPGTINANAYGGTVPVTVSAPAGCSWMGLPGVFFTVQSPAQGSGNGTVFVTVEPNLFTPIADQLTIANTIVTVSQTSANINFGSADSSATPTTLSVPGIGNIDSRQLTSNATDPVHSCTGSADFKTAWWLVTPSATGFLSLRAYGIRYDAFGNSGIVVTAYPQGALTNELTCTIVPRDSNYQIDAVTQIAVTAGMSYLIEISATGSTPQDGGYTVLSVTSSSTGAVTVTVAPSTVTLTAGSGRTQQYSAKVSSPSTPAVRWSLSPAIGTISATGLYTPPASIAAPTNVTITATSFADASKSASATVSIMPPGSGVPIITVVANATGEAPELAPNTWIEVKGANLGPDTRVWQGSDFVNNQLPTQLDGVSVMVNGQPAFVYYISPTQVNILSPLDTSQGSITVEVTNSVGTSGPVTVQLRPLSPGFFQFAGGYAAATHVDGSLLGPTTLYPGSTTPAKPGETIALYANGFGPTTTLVVSGALTQSGNLVPLPTVTIGGVNATVTFAGLVSVGEFQFNVVVPLNLPNGDAKVVATYNGYSSQANVLISVHN